MMPPLRSRSAMLSRPAFLSLLLAFTGCTLANNTPPTVDVLDIHLTGIGLTDQVLSTTLCVTNPNANEIAFRHVTVALDVSGAPLATGSSDTAVRLLPLASSAVPFTVATTVRNVGPQLLGLLRNGGLDYRVYGTVSLTGAFRLVLPFSRSGRLDLLTGGLDLVSAVTDATPNRCQSTYPARSPS